MFQTLFLSLSLVLSFMAKAPQADSFIDTYSEIPVYFTVKADSFPKSWQSKEINAKGVSLEPSEYQRTRAVIEKALKKYPKPLLKQNLKAIYVLNHIEFYGVLYGGTNSNTIVYLANKGIKKGYTNFYLEQTFHHELSSIFLRNFPTYLDKKAWLKVNGEQFNYGKGGVHALKTGKKGLYFTEEANKKGLICQYAKSSFENDFNTFAQHLFLPKKGFSERLKRYKKLHKKRQLIMAFYKKLSPTFTTHFFDSLLQQSVKKESSKKK